MIEESEKLRTYDAALRLWGQERQFLMLIEEMSELTKVILHNMRGRVSIDDIASEFADVEIMMEQFRRIQDKTWLFSELVKDAKEEKLTRLIKRVKLDE